ncbi:hypothetical protein HF685_07355 [Parasphingorhabdus halotolerans]|uniref:Flap endonuclease-1-like 5' DNA nuclease n=1 Tax=Parasphingorhabdus halotolerans TaxID=2725558 RepID=A0A6H2DSJ3_9SPHN|nr:hypothetical protein HF685_07355 [Parasphingorhabdus halotolerans]
MTLISANWLLFLIALLTGVATAFWAWAASGRDDSVSERFDANDGLLEKAGEAFPSTAEPVAPAPTPDAPAAAAAVAVPKPAPAPAPRPRKKPVVAEVVTPPPAGKPKIAAAVGEPDNLRLIKGVGPKLDALLNNLGVTRFDQIATWTAEDIAEVDQYLESFSGRITRDAWIDQAKYLAKDDIAGFEKKYGKL